MESILKEEEKKSILVEGETKSILIDQTLEKITKNSILIIDEKKLREYNDKLNEAKMEAALRRYDIMIERAKIMSEYPDLRHFFKPIEEENYEPIN